MKKNGFVLMAIILLLMCNYFVAFGQICESEAKADPCCVPAAIADAKKAIESNDIKYVMKWVTPKGADEIKDAFNLVMKVRGLSPEVRELSDNYSAKLL